MSKTTPAGVPKVLYVFIIVILAAMYYYAAYIDVSKPEKVVQNFYAAYFDRNYEKVAENLSVFWSVQFLPQYTSQSPAQLLENRDKIVAEVRDVIAEVEKGNQIPPDMSVRVLPQYTKQRPNSALVAYSVQQDVRPASMEMAILIKEAGRYRIYSMTPVNTEALEMIKEEDVDALEESFAELTKQE